MTDTDIPYSETDLIQRAISSASSRHENDCRDGIAAPKARWNVVRDLFCCGSTVAEAICRLYCNDPEGIIGESPQEGEE